jgi:hypothetical protein
MNPVERPPAIVRWTLRLEDATAAHRCCRSHRSSPRVRPLLAGMPGGYDALPVS